MPLKKYTSKAGKFGGFSTIKKKAQAHFLEFVMLFLAVFLGFLADNLRDGFIEKDIEKEYIRSLMEDIEVDKINIQRTIAFNTYRIQKLDTLSNLGFTYGQHQNDAAMYKHYDGVNGEPLFFLPNEQTLGQLNYSNGLRLLTCKKVVKAILKYDYRKQELKRQEEDYDHIYWNTVNQGLRLFSQLPFKEKAAYRKRTGQILKDPYNAQLLSNDALLITEFANTVYLYQSNVQYYNVMLEDAWQSADSLITHIKKEYHIN